MGFCQMAMKHLLRAQSGEAVTGIETDNHAFSAIVKARKGGDGGQVAEQASLGLPGTEDDELNHG